MMWFRKKKKEMTEAEWEAMRKVDWEENLSWDEALARWKQLKKDSSVTVKHWVALVRMLEILKQEKAT